MAAAAANPAFDVTPNRYVTAIITERGVARPPFTESLRRFTPPSPILLPSRSRKIPASPKPQPKGW